MTDTEFIDVGWNPIDITVHLVAGQDWTVNINAEENLPVGTIVVANIYPPGTEKTPPANWPTPDVWTAEIVENSVTWHVESAITDLVEAKSYVRWMISYPLDEAGNYDDYCWAKGLVVRDD